MKRQNYYQLTVLLSFVTMATMSFIVLIEIQLMYKYEYIGFEEFFSDIYFLFLSVLDWQVLFLWIIVAIYSDVVSPELSSISVVHTHTLFLFCGLRLLEGGGGGIHPPSIHHPSILIDHHQSAGGKQTLRTSMCGVRHPLMFSVKPRWWRRRREWVADSLSVVEEWAGFYSCFFWHAVICATLSELIHRWVSWLARTLYFSFLSFFSTLKTLAEKAKAVSHERR